MTELSGWANFYVIVGSSAGALIGLQFVVITLLAQIPPRSGSETAGQAFATPTVVHFGATLLLAAVGAAPWQTIYPAIAHWSVVGIFGIIYSLFVVRRMRSQNSYEPEFEDWLFHAVLPLVAYGALPFAAYYAPAHVHGSLYGVAGIVMLLLFVGIHNAWDAAIYHVYNLRPKRDTIEPPGQQPI